MIAYLLKHKIVITVLFYFLWIFSSIIKGQESSLWHLLFWTSVSLLLIFWLLILIDMMKSSIQNKVFWILSMFFLAFFAPVVYLFQRKNI